MGFWKKRGVFVNGSMRREKNRGGEKRREILSLVLIFSYRLTGPCKWGVCKWCFYFYVCFGFYFYFILFLILILFSVSRFDKIICFLYVVFFSVLRTIVSIQDIAAFLKKLKEKTIVSCSVIRSSLYEHYEMRMTSWGNWFRTKKFHFLRSYLVFG